uniref:Uncharacterized protein n=1 Tax=Lotus japonicus TaxID=34305 RepID=I3SP68_LOTJA|nr:unknown [Lotus japonicus]
MSENNEYSYAIPHWLIHFVQFYLWQQHNKQHPLRCSSSI